MIVQCVVNVLVKNWITDFKLNCYTMWSIPQYNSTHTVWAGVAFWLQQRKLLGSQPYTACSNCSGSQCLGLTKMKWGHSIKGKTLWIATEIWKRKSQSMCKWEELALPVPHRTLHSRTSLRETWAAWNHLNRWEAASSCVTTELSPVFNLHLCFIK